MRSLALRLILAFLAVSLTGTTLVAVLAGRATASEFGHFMIDQNRGGITAMLAGYYREQGSWQGVGSAPPFGMGSTSGVPESGGGMAMADHAGRVVVAGAGYLVGEQASAGDLADGIPIEVDGQVVGTLIVGHGGFGLTPAGAEFLARVNRAFIIASLGATAVALLLGMGLARALTRPLRELTAAARRIAQGHLEQQVRVPSRDELGQLAAAFNQMSADLGHARDLRRQMTADVAHELRTPLSVVLGHAEGLRDGVLPPAPETFTLIHDEALRLNRLVEDLRTLSLAEAGELSLARRRVAPGALVERAVAAQALRAQQQNVALHAQIEPGLPEIDVDADRLAQVLGNLLDNALRHTPAGGVVSVQASVISHPSSVADGQAPARSPDTKPTTGDWLLIRVKDTGPGIAPEELPRIFERFYRADNSRRRDDGGGSGLGLAIAKSIVEAHGGRLWGESRPGQGATFVAQLPIAARN